MGKPKRETLEITFGAMSPPLSTQLCGPSKAEFERWQRIADSITTLYLNEYLTPLQTSGFHRKLGSVIAKHPSVRNR